MLAEMQVFCRAEAARWMNPLVSHYVVGPASPCLNQVVVPALVAMPSLQDLVSELEQPILSIERLTALLCAPLSALSLLPDDHPWTNPDPLPHDAQVLRAIPRIQHALLSKIIPTWAPAVSASHLILLESFFCPSPTSKAASCDVALLAYSTLLSTSPINAFSARILTRLNREYDIHMIFTHLYATRTANEAAISWEGYVRNIAAIPPKVANALHVDGQSIPSELENLQGVRFLFDTPCR